MMKYEYRIVIAKGPMSASQLTDQLGVDSWELVDIFPWPHEGEPALWHYFRREKPESENVVSLVPDKPEPTGGFLGLPSSDGADTGQGTDEVGVDKG